MNALFDCRDAFAETLEALGAQDPRIVVLSNDSVGSSKIGGFKKRFPERLINVGIAEQNLVGVASGMANTGKIPFVCSASCFLTGRALEQIKADVAYTNANVKLIGISAGLAYGPLGPTHHSIEDLAWTRAIANLTVIVPADPVETRQVMRFLAAAEGPAFVRLSRMGVPIVHDEQYQFQVGKAGLLRSGSDVTLIACGVMVTRALEAADILQGRGVSARVLNMATIRPIDTEAIVSAALETGAIVTAEEHTVVGGLGSAVAEVVAEQAPVRMRLLGIPGIFSPTGEAEWILEHFGLTPQGIADEALKLVERKR